MTACTGVEYSSLNSPPAGHAAKTPDQIEVFTTAKPTKKYVEVGTLKGKHDSLSSDEALLIDMKEVAAERGCDALVVTQRDIVWIATCVAYVDG